jgi:hypothetical protein
VNFRNRLLRSTGNLALRLLPAAVVCVLAIAPFAALAASGNSAFGLSGGNGHGHGAPGPIAAAGLPFLAAAGAIGVYVRKPRDRSQQESGGSELCNWRH